MFTKRTSIFLDFASITPVDRRVAGVMNSVQKRMWANPSSIHRQGVRARACVTDARRRIGRELSIKEDEVLFTASGTEANNIAIQGAVRAWKGDGVPHIVTSVIEHSSVLEVCRALEKRGEAEVTYVGVSTKGIISPQHVEKALKDSTVLVSLMAANNEIGTIQPVRAIASRVHAYNTTHGTSIAMHTDASQLACCEDVSLERLGVDMMTLDTSKMYGPRGLGVLACKQRVDLQAILFGGEQEKGLRSGTEHTAAIAGAAEAFVLARERRDADAEKFSTLRDYCVEKLTDAGIDMHVNGSLTESLPHILNICLPGIDAEFLVIQLDAQGVAVAYSSACQSKAEVSRSYVVDALGGEDDCGGSSIRISFGRSSTKKDVQTFVHTLKGILEKDA